MSLTVPGAAAGVRPILAPLVAGYARNDPPKTVTVVGNAPLDVNPERVALIEASDLVVRMTTFVLDAPGAPPRGGRRTDVVVLHRAVVAGPGTFADAQSRLYLLVEPGRLHWEREDRPEWWPEGVDPVSVPNAAFTSPLIDLLGLPHDEAVWPTTGTLCTYLFSELFPAARTRLVGVTLLDDPLPDGTDRTTFDHHWGGPVAVTPEHRLRAESALLRRWRDEGRIEVGP
jgi:hypothetical protein